MSYVDSEMDKLLKEVLIKVDGELNRRSKFKNEMLF